METREKKMMRENEYNYLQDKEYREVNKNRVDHKEKSNKETERVQKPQENIGWRNKEDKIEEIEGISEGE